jgi:hypothetical protein
MLPCYQSTWNQIINLKSLSIPWLTRGHKTEVTWI